MALSTMEGTTTSPETPSSTTCEREVGVQAAQPAAMCLCAQHAAVRSLLRSSLCSPLGTLLRTQRGAPGEALPRRSLAARAHAHLKVAHVGAARQLQQLVAVGVALLEHAHLPFGDRVPQAEHAEPVAVLGLRRVPHEGGRRSAAGRRGEDRRKEKRRCHGSLACWRVRRVLRAFEGCRDSCTPLKFQLWGQSRGGALRFACCKGGNV